MRRLATAAVAGLVLVAGMTQPAMAGPDTGKAILYNAHVDSPKVYWQGDNFTLRSDAAGQSRPVEQTVNWLGRGYSVSGTQLYSMDVPEDGDLAFIGAEPGDVLYSAPAVNGRNNGPIWAGFGADTDIPIEAFRDNKFDLEIVGFNGPGRMEMLTYYPGSPVRRFLSSHDPHLRQTWVDPGNHTHNQTLFTKPGRYEVAFRATARDQQNRVVASAPQTLVWQVGGPNPESETLTDVIAAYNAAPETGSGDFAPEFSVQPNTNIRADGDDRLSTLTFKTGNPQDSGAVVFYADGFYLGEVPVQGGIARWNELLGSQDLSLQAVFVPGEGAPSPRWITAPIELSRTVRTGATSELGEFPQQVMRDPAPEFSTAEYAPTSRVVNFEVNADEDAAQLTVLPEDDQLWFKVTGGAYEAGNDYASCEIEFVSTPSNRTWQSDDFWDCSPEGTELRLDLITPNAVTLSGAKAVFPLSESHPQPVKLGEPAGGETPKPDDPEDPDTPQEPGTPETPDTPLDPDAPEKPETPDAPESPDTPAPNPPSDDSTEADQTEIGDVANDPVTISRGHVDIGPAVVDGKFAVVVNDDSREHAKKSVPRTPGSVTLQLRDNAKVKRSAKAFNDPVFDFLGEMGSEVFVSPMQQKRGIVWPGFSSEHLDRASFPNGVQFEIEQKSAPSAGSWWLFTHDMFNGLDMIASGEASGQIDAPEPLHKHVYWAFNKPGEYVIRVSVYGVDSNGKQVRDSADIRFQIGDEGGADAPEKPRPNKPGLDKPGAGADRGADKSGKTGPSEGHQPPKGKGGKTNGAVPRQNLAAGGANGVGSALSSLAEKVSQGGGAVTVPNGSSGLSGLPVAEALQDGATEETTEPTETTTPSESQTSESSEASEHVEQTVFAAPSSSVSSSKGGVNIPLVIIVASSLVAVAAGTVLVRRRLDKN